MTAEKLHDALNLLPGDLIAATDQLRTQPRRKVLHLRRWVSLAACLAVVICGGWLLSSAFDKSASSDTSMQMESAAKVAAAPAEDQPAAYSGNGSAETRAAVTGEANEAAPKEEGPLADATYGIPEAPASEDANIPVICSAETPPVEASASYSSEPRITVIRSRAELEEYFSHYAYRYDFTALQAACDELDEGWFENRDLLLIALHSVPVNQTCEVTSITEEDGTWYICIANDRNSPESTRTDRHILIETGKDQVPSADSVLLIFE